MKAIIDGKRYDTERATKMAEYGNGLGRSDFRNLDEELYRTDKGAWFLAGEGGAMTKYSVSYAGMSSGGSTIIPMTDGEARSWLENKGEVDVLETFFADTIEDA